MAIRQKMIGRRSTMLPNSIVPERTEMITAILNNNLQTVRKLIQNQESLNVVDQEGRSYLHLTSYFNKAEITDYLIKAGLKVDSRDHNFLTPLHSACFNDSANTVNLLIERGADLNSRDRDWLTPLHICAANNSINCLNFLIKNILCLNITDFNQCTALMYASANGFFRIADNLIRAGADTKLKDKFNRICLHYAVLQNDIRIIQLLINQGLDVNAKDCHGLTPLHIACTTSNNQIVESLINEGANVNERDNENNTPLHYACGKNQDGFSYEIAEERKLICKLLIEHDADLEAKNNLFLTPLHLIYEDGPLLDEYRRLRLDFNQRDYLGRTLLHIVCFRGFNHLIDILIENGADLCARDKFNRIPLHYAVEYSQYTSVAFLIRKNANLVSLVDDNNCNSLHYAAKVGNCGIWAKLIEIFNDFNQKDNFGRTVHFYAAHSKKLLRACLPLPSFLDSFNRNLLFYTLTSEASICSSDSLDFLLSIQNLKLDINQRDVYGRTPLHYAYLLRLDLHIECLLKNYASLYIEDEKGLMPIHYLILTDNNDALTSLIETGLIDLNQNRYKICLMQCASYYGANICLKVCV